MQARMHLPQIPFDPLDVLIVERMGKNISGTGMDPNVIGMYRRNGGVPDRHIDRIVVLDLTEASHGNAIGVGMADVITRRLKEKIDYAAMEMNAVTSGFLAGVKVPMAVATDREAIALACKPYDPARLRAVRIVDTAHLDYLQISAALVPEVAANPQLDIVEDAALQFTEEGELAPFPAELAPTL
jgi:hypothetical protein